MKSFSNNTLEVLTDYKANIGDSIAINGACLTAMRLFEGGMAMELSHHTQRTIALETLPKRKMISSSSETLILFPLWTLLINLIN